MLLAIKQQLLCLWMLWFLWLAACSGLDLAE